MDDWFLLSIFLCCSRLFAWDRYDFLYEKSLLCWCCWKIPCNVELKLVCLTDRGRTLHWFRISSLAPGVVTNGTPAIFPLQKMCNNYVEMLLFLECDRVSKCLVFRPAVAFFVSDLLFSPGILAICQMKEGIWVRAIYPTRQYILNEKSVSVAECLKGINVRD